MYKTVRGTCFSNLDAYKYEEWPSEFVAVPRIGERVQAKSERSLSVVRVTHYMLKDGPAIRVELHK